MKFNFKQLTIALVFIALLGGAMLFFLTPKKVNKIAKSTIEEALLDFRAKCAKTKTGQAVLDKLEADRAAKQRYIDLVEQGDIQGLKQHAQAEVDAALAAKMAQFAIVSQDNMEQEAARKLLSGLIAMAASGPQGEMTS